MPGVQGHRKGRDQESCVTWSVSPSPSPNHLRIEEPDSWEARFANPALKACFGGPFLGPKAARR